MGGMTEKSRVYFFIASCLSILVPIPGRLAYSIALLLLFNIQMFLVTLSFHAMKKINLNNVQNPILVFLLISTTILYKQLLIVLCPMLALVLGFALYCPALSVVAIQIFFEKRKENFLMHLKDSMSKSLQISASLLIYFFVREAIGYGTVSFPGSKIIIIELPIKNFIATTFLSTIPGNFVLIALILIAFVFVRKKMNIFQNVQKSRITEVLQKQMSNENSNGEEF